MQSLAMLLAHNPIQHRESLRGNRANSSVERRRLTSPEHSVPRLKHACWLLCPSNISILPMETLHVNYCTCQTYKAIRSVPALQGNVLPALLAANTKSPQDLLCAVIICCAYTPRARAPAHR